MKRKEMHVCMKGKIGQKSDKWPEDGKMEGGTQKNEKMEG